MTRLIALCTALALIGCSTQPKWNWAKDGSTQQDFNMDNGQCRAQAFSVASGNMMQIALVHDGCMQGKGWYKVPN